MDISVVLKLGYEWIREKARRIRRRHDVIEGVAVELHELRFILANVVTRLRAKLRTFDQTTLDLVRPIFLSYTALSVRDAQIIAGVKKLFALGDVEYMKLCNLPRADSDRAILPVPYQAPFLKALISNPGPLSTGVRRRLVDISNELHLFNQQVDYVRQAHSRSFDSTLSPENYAANDRNLKEGTAKLSVRVEALVMAINNLLAPDGTVIEDA